jgi:hypothetical protein
MSCAVACLESLPKPVVQAVVVVEMLSLEEMLPLPLFRRRGEIMAVAAVATTLLVALTALLAALTALLAMTMEFPRDVLEDSFGRRGEMRATGSVLVLLATEPLDENFEAFGKCEEAFAEFLPVPPPVALLAAGCHSSPHASSGSGSPASCICGCFSCQRRSLCPIPVHTIAEQMRTCGGVYACQCPQAGAGSA